MSIHAMAMPRTPVPQTHVKGKIFPEPEYRCWQCAQNISTTASSSWTTAAWNCVPTETEGADLLLQPYTRHVLSFQAAGTSPSECKPTSSQLFYSCVCFPSQVNPKAMLVVAVNTFFLLLLVGCWEFRLGPHLNINLPEENGIQTYNIPCSQKLQTFPPKQ